MYPDRQYGSMIPPIFINCIGFVRNDQSNSAECLFSLSAQYSSTQEIVGAQRKRDWKRVKLIYIYTTLLHFIVGNEYIFFFSEFEWLPKLRIERLFFGCSLLSMAGTRTYWLDEDQKYRAHRKKKKKKKKIN